MQNITIQKTDNQNIIKFITPQTLIEGSLDLDRNSEIEHIPLAKELFNFPFINKIFITANFIAVGKENVVEWELIAPNLSNIIAESLENFPEIVLPKNDTILQLEQTPNPEVIKFVADRPLITGFLELKSKEDAKQVPLAKKLFEELDCIKEIFINDYYLSITKTENADWEQCLEPIQQCLSDFFHSGEKISHIEGIHQETQAQSINNRKFTETEEKINAILAEYVAPAVENDGGKISLISFDEHTKTAKMLLQGACSGCPSSTITLKMGIENLLKNLLPDVVENVEAVNG